VRARAALVGLLLTAGATAGVTTAAHAPSAQGLPSWPVPLQQFTLGSVEPGCTFPRPASERAVSPATKRIVAEWYGVDPHTPGLVFDHRVPFSECGGQGPDNIWPEGYDGAPASTYVHNRKDQLELTTARLVRSGKLPLKDAQAIFLGDWRVGWCALDHKPGDGVTCP
jgi:hypothetical protein